jgi:hypothetical protein
LTLDYEKGVGIFEASWDLPRSYQDLEIFGWDSSDKRGSIYMEQHKVEMRHGKKIQQLNLTPLPESESRSPIWFPGCVRVNRSKDSRQSTSMSM